ncbi:MAG: glycosyltransferase family 9 protein [Fibrobacteres bacterium]|nr:glycosyltransferase family 9 protein [Fibrobacterota bacterium]
MNLLAICPIGIGNFLLLAPALNHLHEKKPGIRISLLALKKGIAPIAARYPAINEVIAFDATEKKSITDKLRFIASLNSRFDTSIAFYPCNRLEYNLLPVLAGIPSRIAFGYSSFYYKTLSFLNTMTVQADHSLHDLEQNLFMLKALGIEPPAKPEMAPLPLTQAEKEWADSWLKDRDLDNGILIGYHPGSSAEHGMDKKRWPADRFSELASRIGKKSKHRYLIFGGPEENRLKHEVTESIGPAAVSVDTSSFFETAAIIARCSRFVSNDSGLMHVAVACGVPTCGIFGPTDDKRTAPYGKTNIVVRGEEPCSPCWTHKNVGRREECATFDYRCLERISSEYVYAKIAKWLQ